MPNQRNLGQRFQTMRKNIDYVPFGKSKYKIKLKKTITYDYEKCGI